MVEFGWETTAARQEAAALLRQLADGLAGDGKVELEQQGAELKVEVADEVSLEVELEVEQDQIELEIELSWAPPGARTERREGETGASEDGGEESGGAVGPGGR